MRYIFLSDIENAYITYLKEDATVKTRLASDRCRTRCPCITAPCRKEKERRDKAKEEYLRTLEGFAESNGISDGRVDGLRKIFETYHQAQSEEKKRHLEKRDSLMDMFYRAADGIREVRE
jgi:hypothetical protein